jgi:hypothetical protein
MANLGEIFFAFILLVFSIVSIILNIKTIKISEDERKSSNNNDDEDSEKYATGPRFSIERTRATIQPVNNYYKKRFASFDFHKGPVGNFSNWNTKDSLLSNVLQSIYRIFLYAFHHEYHSDVIFAILIYEDFLPIYEKTYNGDFSKIPFGKNWYPHCVDATLCMALYSLLPHEYEKILIDESVALIMNIIKDPYHSLDRTFAPGI